MDQSRTTPSAKVPIREPVRVRPTVNRNCARCWFKIFDVEVWKDSGHSVGGRRLVTTFCAVAYEKFLWFVERCLEFDLSALAWVDASLVSVHSWWPASLARILFQLFHLHWPSMFSLGSSFDYSLM